MRYAALLLLCTVSIVLSGCGNSDLRDKVAENSGRVDNMELEIPPKLDLLSKRVADVEKGLLEKIESVEKSLETIKNSIEGLSDGDISFAEIADAKDEKFKEMNEDIQLLREEIAAIRDDIKEVRSEALASKATPREDPHQDWKEMAMPAKLAEKLDLFIDEYAPKLDETGRRTEFEADMNAYREEVTKEYSTEELLENHKQSLQRQIDEATDDRMKQWYQRQLQALSESEGQALKARLENYRRYENMRELSEIARKYNISRTELRNYGLQIYGGGGSPR
jgi:hypothetical protein